VHQINRIARIHHDLWAGSDTIGRCGITGLISTTGSISTTERAEKRCGAVRGRNSAGGEPAEVFQAGGNPGPGGDAGRAHECRAHPVGERGIHAANSD